jgi:hypothetical protein
MTEQKTAVAGETRPAAWGSCERIGAGLANLLAAVTPSEEVRMHFRAARVEVLKGLRAALDARIERASTEDRQTGKSVTVE